MKSVQRGVVVAGVPLLLGACAALIGGGCGEEFVSGSASAGAGASGAMGGEAGGAGGDSGGAGTGGAAGGAGGEAGGAGGAPEPEPPVVFECHCLIETPEGGLQNLSRFICARPENGYDLCVDKCADYDDDNIANKNAKLDYAQNTGDMCPPELEGEVISGGRPNSSAVVIDPTASELLLSYAAHESSSAVGGDVQLNGGCESGRCRIELLHAQFEVAGASVGQGASSMQLGDVHMLSVGNVVVDQSDGYFRIPYEQVKLILNAQVDGEHRASRFTPFQDLHGYYQPSSGDLEIFGELFAGADGVSLDLRGKATSRAPHADAGPPRGVTANAAGVAPVKLDGKGTFDPDNDLTDIVWYEGSKVLAHGTTPTITLDLGKHVITARAVDATNKWNDAETVVDVRKP